MSEERQAQQLIDEWVKAHVAPKIEMYLSAEEYLQDGNVQSLYDSVRVHRTNSGQVHVIYTNARLTGAIKKLFGEKYLVHEGLPTGKSYVIHITPKG